jgi:hypothetical protein
VWSSEHTLHAGLRRLRHSRGWSLHDMAQALRDTARAIGATSLAHVQLASVRRSIERWESPTSKAGPGNQYQILLAHLFARTPDGAVALGPGSDFETFLIGLTKSGIPPQRIDHLADLVRQTTAVDRAEPTAPAPASHACPQPNTRTPEQVLPDAAYRRRVTVRCEGDIVGDDVMSPLDRRAVISYGVAAAAAASLHDAERALLGTAPPTFKITPGASWASGIYDAVLNPTEAARRVVTDETNLLADDELRAAADQAIQRELTSDFRTLERSLPALIGNVEATTITTTEDHRQTLQALSDVYAVVAWTLIKADMPVGAWIAAQRAIDAAERADDALRVAAATRCLAEVHMRAGNLEEATRTAFLATIYLDGASEDRQSALLIRGAALLSAAAASARRRHPREAHAALQAATVCGDRLGRDCADFGTVFGPTNVAIHRVAVAVELGETREAIRQIPDVHLDRLPRELTERRSRFLIDVARTFAAEHDDQAAIDALVEAERTAPDELRSHRLTREIVPQLMKRERRSSGLRELAERCRSLA